MTRPQPMTNRPAATAATSTAATSTYIIVASPIGALTLVAADGALTGLYMDAQRYRPHHASFGRPGTADFGAAREQLAEYFAGDRTQFDLPLAPRGTPFQRRVWAGLATIPYGRTWSYAELTAAIGADVTRIRAVGSANGRNPLSIVVPCHRVIGSDGRLVGYGGGLERKQFLLDLERGRT